MYKKQLDVDSGKKTTVAYQQVGTNIKDVAKGIIGKHIAGVVAKKRKGKNPPCQVFLIFPDRTNIEFYVDGNERKPRVQDDPGADSEERESCYVT